MAHPARRFILLVLALALALTAMAAAPTVASTGRISLDDAHHVAVKRMKKMERKLWSEGARASGVRGCWREKRRAVGCLGMVSGRDSGLRWRCAVPMTIRKRPAATTAKRRIAVKYTDPMCSF